MNFRCRCSDMQCEQLVINSKLANILMSLSSDSQSEKNNFLLEKDYRLLMWEVIDKLFLKRNYNCNGKGFTGGGRGAIQGLFAMRKIMFSRI